MKNKITYSLGVVLFAATFVSFANAQSSSPTPSGNAQPASGSDLTQVVAREVDSRLSVSTPTDGLSTVVGGQPVFSGEPPFTNTSTIVNWPRNSAAWTQKNTPLDLTGVALWNDASGVRGAATLITPRHYVTADHLSLVKGTNITFFTKGGSPVTRTVMDTRKVPNSDINVGVLDRDVDANITFYPLIRHVDLERMLQKAYYQAPKVPMLVMNQYHEALVFDINSLANATISFGSPAGIRAGFNKALIGGDSGQPGFLLVNGRPVLISTNYTPQTGPSLGNYISEINQALSALGGGYNVTEFNSASFAKNDLYYAPPLSLVATGPKSSCVLNATLAAVDLEWKVPVVGNSYKIPDYKLTIDDSKVIMVHTDYISNDPYPTNLKYTVSNLAPAAAHKFMLQAVYGSNLSAGVNTEAYIPLLCGGNQPTNQNTSGGAGSSPTATPTSQPTTPPSNQQTNNTANTNSGNTNNQQNQNNYPYYTPTYSPSSSPSSSPKSNTQGTGVTTNNTANNNNYANTNTGGSFNQGGSPQYGSSAQYGGSSSVYYGNNYVNYDAGYGSGSSGTGVSHGSNGSSYSPSVRAIARNLKVGDMGADVNLLQRSLNVLGYKIAEEGPGSPGKETAYFGESTKQALVRYQEDHSETGVIPSGNLDNVTMSLLNSAISKNALKINPRSSLYTDNEIKSAEINATTSTSTLRQNFAAKFRNSLRNLLRLLNIIR